MLAFFESRRRVVSEHARLSATPRAAVLTLHSIPWCSASVRTCRVTYALFTIRCRRAASMTFVSLPLLRTTAVQLDGR
jgi:hypothetical protein